VLPVNITFQAFSELSSSFTPNENENGKETYGRKEAAGVKLGRGAFVSC